MERCGLSGTTLISLNNKVNNKLNQYTELTMLNLSIYHPNCDTDYSLSEYISGSKGFRGYVNVCKLYCHYLPLAQNA